jgi:hypothetical protein
MPRLLIAFLSLTSFLITTTAQSQSPTERKRLTVVCYWGNCWAYVFDMAAIRMGAKQPKYDWLREIQRSNSLQENIGGYVRGCTERWAQLGKSHGGRLNLHNFMQA